MELARTLIGASSLGHGPARWASLRVVGQTLRGKKGLLAGREDELLATIAAGQTTVLVHALQTLPRSSDAMTVEPEAWVLAGPQTNVR